MILFDVTVQTGSAIAAAEALWDLCSTDSRINAELVSATAIDDDRGVMVVRPGLGDRAWRRLEGCVEDMRMLDMTAAADRLWPEGGQRDDRVVEATEHNAPPDGAVSRGPSPL